MAPQIAVLALTVVGLAVGARLFVDAAVRFARRFGLSEFVIGLTIVGIGTSAPELVVSADAALIGRGDLAVGNVIGSNIFNLALILGGLALFGAIPVDRSAVRRDGAALVLATAIGGVVLLDATVARAEGVAMVACMVAYIAYLLGTGDEAASEPGDGSSASSTARNVAESTPPGGLARGPTRWSRTAAELAAGLALVLASGHFMVESASALALAAGISELVVGETIVAAGTSTPELAVSLVAVRRGRVGVSVGNILGSNVFNLLGILGVAAIVRPLAASPAVLTGVAWLAAITVAAVAALWTGRRLSRPEGGLLALSELVRWGSDLL
ncbi:calcium/sodium antiporter [Natronoarchaeum mannanilyticum]|uniref:Calcium/sodium antiporter n=1 Tax=Natronoarchaeum mannanilyticum TaxID=926360 RepID=A0AAV3T5K9_9EURY